MMTNDNERETQAYLARIRKTIAESNRLVEQAGLRIRETDRMLEQQGLKYLRRGLITYEELRNWNRGHHIYHDLLGGNGDLNELKEKLTQLLYGTKEDKP